MTLELVLALSISLGLAPSAKANPRFTFFEAAARVNIKASGAKEVRIVSGLTHCALRESAF